MDFSTGRLSSSALRCRAAGRWPLILLVAFAALGCQNSAPTVSNRTLLAHLPGIDFAGLTPSRTFNSVQVRCSIPSNWVVKETPFNGLYAVAQFKSPTYYSGAGVVHARLPIPVNAKAVLWLAKLEYSKKKGSTGKEMGEWTDELGRPWFEAENDQYHVRGYAITDGFDAWIVFYGYKLSRPMSPSELSLAARCVDTVIPMTGEQTTANPSVASAGRTRK
jgi:hypothetical protein